MGFPGGSAVKNAPANTGDLGLIPGSEKSCDKGNDNPPQYSCLEISEEPGRLHFMGHKRVRYILATQQQQYVCMYVCMYVCVCVCVYIYIYISPPVELCSHLGHHSVLSKIPCFIQ